MANSKDLVTTAKPKTSGAVYVAPIGTALPTDATSSLAEAYKGLGYNIIINIQMEMLQSQLQHQAKISKNGVAKL